MDIKNHFFIGLILSFILFPFFKFYSFFVILPSVLLDMDHYLLFVIRTRRFNLKESISYHKEKCLCGQHNLCIFHTVEFLLLLGVFSFFSEFFLLIFIGALVHSLIDYFDWFVWFSHYSGRIPSIILTPLVLKQGKQIDKKIERLGKKCIVCGFDKAWDSHFIDGYKEVMLCPNHHHMVHKGLISEKELIKLQKQKN